MGDEQEFPQANQSFAKDVHLDGPGASKLDGLKGLNEKFAEAQTKTHSPPSSNDNMDRGQTTSFAKSIEFDGQKKNSLDELEYLRSVYARAKDNGIDPSLVKEQAGRIGPAPDAGKHLRLPDSVERRIVDSKIHQEQLAEGRDEARERNAAFLKEYQEMAKQQGKSRGPGR